MIPYNHDEWAWGTQEGINNFHNFFQGYNGRYFGDLIALVITRSQFIKAIIMSGSTVSLIIALVGFSDLFHHASTNTIFFILTTLTLATPLPLFAQIYGWPAAFINFVPPIIFIIYLFLEQFKVSKNISSTREMILVGSFITLGTQFFSENLTIYLLLLSGLFIIDSLIARKKIFIFHILMTLVSVLGTIIMFINPAYSNAAKGTDGYKSIGVSFSDFFGKIIDIMIPNMFTNYGLLLMLLFTLICILYVKSSIKKNLVDKLFIVIIGSYPVFCLFFLNHMNFGNELFTNILLFIFTIAFYLSLLMIFIRIFTGINQRALIMLLLSVGLVSAPLIIANPIGPRSFYGAYIFWILIVAILINTVLSTTSVVTIHITSYIARISTFTLISFYLLTFIYSFYGQINRNQLIQTGIKENKTEIILPELPNAQFVWKTSSNNPNWNARFKRFYRIPNNIKVIFPDAPDYNQYKIRN